MQLGKVAVGQSRADNERSGHEIRLHSASGRRERPVDRTPDSRIVAFRDGKESCEFEDFARLSRSTLAAEESGCPIVLPRGTGD